MDLVGWCGKWDGGVSERLVGVLTFNSFSALIRLSLPFGFGSKIGPSSSASALVFVDEAV